VAANNSPTQFYKVVTLAARTKTIQRHADESAKYSGLQVTQYELSRARPQR
jgi:hypothetical protein